jgi:hypothetical protein
MLILLATASANGLTSHVTISEMALPLLPEGELADILRDPELWPWLQNGTQFPDGGYPLGEAYAETAHWEPFHDRYLAWIAATYAGDYRSAEARQHIAWLFGMQSHGMGDQIFDSLYMQRAYTYDAESDWDGASMDEATDVALAAETGGQETLEPFVPTDVLVPLMAEAGVDVSADTLQSGQTLTAFAISYVREAGKDPAKVAEYADAFPWACAHMMGRGTPGAPAWEADVVARYWQSRWGLLSGEPSEVEPILFSFPQAGSFGHATDSTTVESRLTVVFSRGLMADLLVPDLFEVRDTEGNPYELLAPWVFYGTGSHVVHLSPVADWPDDTDFVLTVHAGAPFIDGTTAETDVEIPFSTRPPPAEAADAPEECGCDQGTAGTSAPLALLVALLARRRGGANALRFARGLRPPPRG